MLPGKTELLTSDKNELLKEIRRSVARGTLTQDGYAVAEGFHLLEEAVRSNCRIKVVLAAESVRGTVDSYLRVLSGARVAAVREEVFRRISSTESSQGVIALVRPPAWSLEQVFHATPLIVIVDGIQDPGNAGAILRTAEAFGASGAVFLRGSVNPYNPKALRAAAGSVFRLPLVEGADTDLVCAALEQNHTELFAAAARGGRLPAQADFTGPVALAIGSEAHGVSARLKAASLGVSIPTRGVESLNAAVAAGILLYEASRQRVPCGPV